MIVGVKPPDGINALDWLVSLDKSPRALPVWPSLAGYCVVALAEMEIPSWESEIAVFETEYELRTNVDFPNTALLFFIVPASVFDLSK